MPLLTLIFAFIAIIYAVTVKCRRREWRDATLLTLVGGIALYNSIFMYGFFTGELVSASLRQVQQVVSSMIVPIAYMYFAAQMGRSWLNRMTVNLWGLILLLLVPSGLYTLDGIAPDQENMEIAPMMLYFFRNGNEVFSMHTADVIIMLQALFTLNRIVGLVFLLRRYRLGFSPQLRYFLVWCGGMIAFIIFTSLHNTHELGQPHLLWTYYIAYSAMIVTIFVLIAQNFNLRPVMLEVEEDENDNVDDNDVVEEIVEDVAEEAKEADVVVEDVDRFIMQSKAMAELLRSLIDKGLLRNPDIGMEDVVRELGTNRTYFCRMMRAEFDCTFTELLTTYRINHAAMLLLETEISIADIASQSGFSDTQSFSRRFKKIKGVSPMEYRKAATY